ncbi:MAG: radical SAM protein [Planctomycetes bacterium]|nr:radical SAM protein [Planctomycetota bacterium]
MQAVPRVFEDNEEAVRISKGLFDTNKNLQAELQRNKVWPVFWHSLGGYRPLCKNKVEKVEDFRGLKMRAWGEFVLQLWSALGAAPVNVLPGEIYEALQRGTLDCAFWAYDLLYAGNRTFRRLRRGPDASGLTEFTATDSITDTALQEIAAHPNDFFGAWIRLMYLYPIYFNDELIDTIAGSSKIIPYLDLPLQHINDTVLKRMQRRVDRRGTTELIEKLRRKIPNVVLRTTFIVGFPGETDAQFEELKDFVRETRFERMGVFEYSLEPETPAVKLDGHLPDDVKQARWQELMQLQQDIAFDFGESLVGYELDVLIDAEVETDTEEIVWQGRTFADAPEIDGNVYVTGEGIRLGEFVPVEITGCDGYDLIGVYEEEAASEIENEIQK